MTDLTQPKPEIAALESAPPQPAAPVAPKPETTPPPAPVEGQMPQEAPEAAASAPAPIAEAAAPPAVPAWTPPPEAPAAPVNFTLPELAPEPQQAAYEDPYKYLSDHAAWQVQKNIHDSLATFRKQQVELSAQQEAQRLTIAWAQARAKAKAELPDFDAVVMRPDLPISPAMAKVIQGHPAGAQIAYHLGKHPDQAYAIARMNQNDALLHMGAIAAEVSRPKAPTVSLAPAPVKPLGGGGSGTSRSPEEMTPEEYVRWRRTGSA